MSRLSACGHEAFPGEVGTGSASGNAPANNQIGARTYGSVKSILTNDLDRQAANKPAADVPTIIHPNIRGARYYH